MFIHAQDKYSSSYDMTPCIFHFLQETNFPIEILKVRQLLLIVREKLKSPRILSKWSCLLKFKMQGTRTHLRHKLTVFPRTVHVKLPLQKFSLLEDYNAMVHFFYLSLLIMHMVNVFIINHYLYIIIFMKCWVIKSLSKGIKDPGFTIVFEQYTLKSRRLSY